MPDETHGFVAVLAESDAALNTAASVSEPYGWVLRVHYHLGVEPEPDPMLKLQATIQEMQAEIEQLKGVQVGG